MNSDIKIMGYQLLSDCEVELHSNQELQGLVKAKVLTKEDLHYNSTLNKYLQQLEGPNLKKEDNQAHYKKLIKDLGKMNQLSELDRVLILNNHYQSQAELRLKVQNCENLTGKERKIVLDHFQQMK